MHICNQTAHLKVVQIVLVIFCELGGFFMRIYHAKDYADMSRKAANIVSAQVIMKPNCVLGLATGSTPIGLYKQLVEWFKKGDLDFSEVMTVNLDEYKGLSRENDQSYYYFMHQNLFDHVNIPVENTHLPNGMEPDSQKECKRYTELIQSLGGVDLQLLGIGHNGHIGFNEPGESFDKQVHCVNLTESTIEANKRFLHRLMMFRSRLIQWASRPSCRLRRFLLLQVVRIRQRLFTRLSLDRLHHRCRLLYCSCTMMLRL